MGWAMFLGLATLFCSYTVLAFKSRTSSVGKVDDSELRGLRFKYPNKPFEKHSACAVGQGTLPKVVLDNDHLL